MRKLSRAECFSQIYGPKKELTEHEPWCNSAPYRFNLRESVYPFACNCGFTNKQVEKDVMIYGNDN